MHCNCICGVISMSDFNWCHGPSCHTNHTLDRVRGSKGNKVLRTRKITLNGYNIHNGWSYFCSQGCWNDFFHKHASQCINIAPRREPLETPIEDPERTKHETNWGHTYYNTRIREKGVDNSSG